MSLLVFDVVLALLIVFGFGEYFSNDKHVEFEWLTDVHNLKESVVIPHEIILYSRLVVDQES